MYTVYFTVVRNNYHFINQNNRSRVKQNECKKKTKNYVRMSD